MRVFVAGATGAIGRPLVSALLAAGHEVVGMTRSPERAERLRAAGAEPMVLDVYDAAGLHAALEQVRPEVVVNQLTDLPAAYTTNTRKLAAVERGAPGVYNVVDDEPAPLREWLPVYAAALGAKPPRRMPELVARLLAGRAATAAATSLRGASNAKARRELGWAPRHPTWREGFRA